MREKRNGCGGCVQVVWKGSGVVDRGKFQSKVRGSAGWGVGGDF